MTSTPPPPGWSPPPPRGGSGLPGWAWGLIALAAVVLVGGPLVVAGLLFARSSGPEAAPAPPRPAPTTPAPSSPPTAEDDGPDDGDGPLAGLLDDLLGGMDPATLAACIGQPDGSREPLPEDVDAAIATIADQVAADRQLTFTDPVDPVLLPAEDLQDRVVELTTEDYPEDVAEVDARLLAALGAVPPDTDLRQLQLDLLGGQVAGFYDPRTGELTSVSVDGLDPTTRVTLAHELNHALVDQAIGLPDLEGFAGRSDEGLATLAVIEGDATLLMQRWALQQLTLLEQIATATTAMGPAEQLGAAPWVLQQQLVFPYTAGLDLACRVFADGGWDAVDALYEQGPTTSAEVLWPERLGTGAVDVPDPALPDGWAEARRDQLGAADLLWLLQAPGDDRTAGFDDAEDRARAWAGGEVAVGTRGDDTTVVVHLAEHPDAPVALCTTVTGWYGRAFPQAAETSGTATTFRGDRQAAAVACEDGQVRLAIAPDVDTATVAVQAP